MIDSAEVSTIAALSTAPAPAGVAVIRVSGPDVRLVIPRVFSSKKNILNNQRVAVFGEFLDTDGKAFDQVIAIFFQGPASFTGEDTVEFHCHGNPFLTNLALKTLYSCGCTPAEPGEFTKRAFHNNKMDLAQAEAVSDIIHAQSERSLRIAAEQLNGRLSNAVDTIGEPLRDVCAQIEAHIDFPEEDIEPEAFDALRHELIKADGAIKTLMNSYDYGQKIRNGFRVLLCGPPNAGKSSLLNWLLGRERAIVSDIAGTTRDIIEESALFDGFEFVFCDSAGITSTSDKIEQIGVELAKDKISWADLIFFVVDGSAEQHKWDYVVPEFKDANVPVWLIRNMIDKGEQDKSVLESFEASHSISVHNETGLVALRESLICQVRASSEGLLGSSEVITNERHFQCLSKASTFLNTCIAGFSSGVPLEIVSEDLRLALRSLREIAGETHNEDILGRIFSRFCIGK